MPASPSTARAINDRLALRLLQQDGPLTATQLKTLTGLSRPTVADLVERLQGAGLIRVVGETGAERRGPNARLYGIAADRAHLAALDVRTRSVAVVVADLVGTTLAEATLPIGSDTDTEAAAERAAALLERTAREAGAGPLHSVGIGAPGLIDPVTGELRDTSGLPAWHRRLVRVLQQRLPATVLVENETNLAAVAEHRGGAATDRDTFVLFWLGHGVGAAVMLDGKLRRGASGGAGEIGFLPVPGTAGAPSALNCDGGFHSLVGSAPVCELAAAHGIAVPPGAAEGDKEPGAASAVRAALAGEGDHEAFLDALAERLALGAAAIAAVLDPGCVLLAGEVGHAGGAALAARVEERLTRMSPLRTEVRAGRLGGAAVLRGALLAARDAAQDELFTPAG
ncbi:ROK family transcriptional regulator [Streptomyces sp. NBC_00257]|uniref:ROK family transcriptional regulator n=1 Tax=unclassified Streptomyces TaxID=2593676 RepID=UPI0022536A52|nr:MULTISPECIES: ROK family transcriptional regulator [unclassified Streptomyces]MCX5432972.1 ROK family transcriptional regulator [Streptomyces sp. NBC_00062]WTB53129.1 ROK family transcriptional regulator [Streptomyces sp. NBC_00826]WTH93980.1 ROK family transcriptional regulator [Streptomyces sp. NBC_00825]WTI02715.1 ROK family transcriptional regulator [Streptomyces sp. NBC_00822]